MGLPVWQQASCGKAFWVKQGAFNRKTNMGLNRFCSCAHLSKLLHFCIFYGRKPVRLFLQLTVILWIKDDNAKNTFKDRIQQPAGSS